MNIIYLVTHLTMVICFFGIICSSVELPIQRRKARTSIPVLKNDSASKKPDLKKEESSDYTLELQPKINQKIFSRSPGIKYDMERLN